MNAISYLTNFGYTGEQAYMILTAAPVEGRIGGIVDIPNCACTVALLLPAPATMPGTSTFWPTR